MTTALSPADGSFDGRSDVYLASGLSALAAIGSALEGLPAPVRILELACGHGLVTRVLRARFPDAEIVVSDPDRAALDFVASRFGAVALRPEEAAGPSLPDGVFDLIWTGSLLTRLPQDRARRLLDLAARHMHERSRLVVATRGRHAARQLHDTDPGLGNAASCGLLADHRTSGYGFRRRDDQSDGIALVARRWFETLLPAGPLRLQAWRARGWDRRFDVAVLRLAPLRPMARWRRRVSTWRGIVRTDYAAGSPPTPSTDLQAAADDAVTPGFDEAFYLRTYPDVAAAVASGGCPSGGWHYRQFGWKERRWPADPATEYENRMPPVPSAYLGGAGPEGTVAAFWSEDPADVAADGGDFWLSHPLVRARINRLASGASDRDAYDHLAIELSGRGIALPIPRAVSLGCGFGALERDLAARGIVGRIDAYDIAPGAIREAAREAQRLGMDGLRYHVADLDRIDLEPGSVDVVFGHASVHHVERLETLYATVHRTLRRDGVFHLYEYVGPTRFQWTDMQLELINEFLDGLPPRLRELPDGSPKERLRRPTIEEMIAADPSESVRSGELVGLLAPLFDIVERRDLGGTLLHMALGGIAQNFRADDPGDVAVLEHLFDVEDRAMRDGTIDSDFAVITAVPRRPPPA